MNKEYFKLIFKKKSEFEGYLENAILDFTKTIESDPKHYKAYINRAYCYEKQGAFVDAEKDYLEALKILPDSPNIYNYLASIKIKTG